LSLLRKFDAIDKFVNKLDRTEQILTIFLTIAATLFLNTIDQITRDYSQDELSEHLQRISSTETIQEALKTFH
jgi:hypothetical protein